MKEAIINLLSLLASKVGGVWGKILSVIIKYGGSYVADFFISIIEKYNVKQEQKKAIEEMKQAETEEEIKNANKNITKNIP